MKCGVYHGELSGIPGLIRPTERMVLPLIHSAYILVGPSKRTFGVSECIQW